MELSEEKLSTIYSLNDCIDWLKENSYASTSLQFSKESLEFSSRICLYLKKRTQTQFYISHSMMCCVDYLSVQHLNDSVVDSIIFFGNVCLTESQFSDSLPVLYVFPQYCEVQSLKFIETSINAMKSKNTLILYETFNAFYALELMSKISENKEIDRNVSVGKLKTISEKWNFTKNISKAIIESNSCFSLGPFSLPNKLESFELVVYLGQSSPLELRLNCQKLLEIDVKNRTERIIYSNKELRKRVALIEKFKQKSCQSIGIVFTNPLPNVNQFFIDSKKLAKKLKKKVYLISLLLTIDEYKLGNFPELNAFVVVNSCFCSSALNSINYCLPVLNWTEFEMSAKIAKEYGGVQWNHNLDELISDSDESDVNELSNQLIQTEVFDTNKWFGLEVNAGDREPAVVKSGQKGIPSLYENENLF